jgi:Ca-activated chloride channel homolog
MTRSPRRDVERRLIDTPAGEPPEGLLERLRADVPERLELAAEPPPRRTAAFPPRWLAAAAVVVLTLGGGWLLWRLSGAVPAPGSERREAVAGAAVADATPEADGEQAGTDGPPAAGAATSGPRSGASATPDAEAAQELAARAGSLDQTGGRETLFGGRRGDRPGGGGGASAPGSPASPSGGPAAGGAVAAPPRAPEAGDSVRRPAEAEERSAAGAAGATRFAPPLSAVAPSSRVDQPVPEAGAPAAAAPRHQRLAATAAPERPAEVAAKEGAAARTVVPEYARLDDRIEATVLEHGERRAGIEVTLVEPDGSRRHAVTDDRGVARFDDIEPGSYRLLARHGDVPPAVVALEVAGARGRTTTALLQLAPAAPAAPQVDRPLPTGPPIQVASPLQVAVVDEDRSPLPGATVRVSPGSLPSRVVGAGGRVGLDLPPGRYRLTASLEGFTEVSTEVEVRGGGGDPANVELRLPLAFVAEHIVVTADALTIASSATTAGAVRDRAERRRVAPVPKEAAPPPPAAPSAPLVRQRPDATGATTGTNAALYRDMTFRDYGVHPFVATSEDRLSTFGLDVDTGSWGLVQGYLRRGQLPPAAAVRVEEVVNALGYGDPAPARGETFRIAAEGAPTPFSPGPDHRLLRFGLRARSIDPRDRRPATLTFVVDVSGSMAGGGRLELVKEALGLLLDQLRDGDRVAVVAFSDEARVVLAPTGDPGAARRAIATLAVQGSTNAEAGLALGYRLAWQEKRPGTANRVLLLSDGVANVGGTDAESLLARAAGAAADGIELTTVGVGMGNYDDVLLEQLANRGDGRYAYVDDVAAARRLFVEELAGTLETVAEEARVQVEFDPRVVASWRLLGYENRDLEDHRFRHDDTVDAGEIGAGHTVTALYEVRLAGEPPPAAGLAHLKLRYRDPESGRFTETGRTLRVADLSPTWEEAPRSLRLAAVAAELAEQLRGSEHAAGADPADLARRARAAAADFPGDERAAELADLAARAARLAPRR